jgi:hypothetical protein
MMKYYATLIILILGTFSAFAQDTATDEEQEGSSFGLFYAMPVADFKSTDISGGGFAKPGWGIVFDSRSNVKFLPENWDFYFHSTFQWNNMDNEKLQEAFTRELGNRTVVSKSKYSPILTTIGPSYMLKLGKNTRLAFNTGVGIMFNNTRAFSVRVYDNNNNEIVRETVNFDNDPAFAYVVGLELKFKLVEGLMGGALYVDYTGAKQTTTLSFDSVDPVKSFEKLQYLNLGFKLTFPKSPSKRLK